MVEIGLTMRHARTLTKSLHRLYSHASITASPTGPSSGPSPRPIHVYTTKSSNGSSSSSSSATSRQAHSLEIENATRLTDELLEYTRSLMTGTPHHVIAYSGGIDSSVVAALVYHSRSPEETVQAVLGVSAAVPADQVALAEHVASVIGVPLHKIPTTEGSDLTYIENNGQACLACKTHLYTCLGKIANHASSHGQQLYNGTNADDLQDPTRLGLIAADRFQVKSPLKHTTKDQVRIVGKHLGLPNWNYAASPCLRSRLAFGVEATPDHLQRIERAEQFVRQSLALDATRNLRVRLLTQNRAMIEIEEDLLELAQNSLERWQGYFQNVLEFASVNVRQFKSGSIAKVVVPTYDHQIATQ